MPTRAARQRPRLKDEPLKRSLLLAGLLHVWLAVLVGTAPGDAPQGEAAGGGKLTVRLQGTPSATSGGVPDTQADRGPVGDAPSRRFGGTVRREDEPPPPEQPGAAREGEWAPQPSAVRQLEDSRSAQGSRAEPITPLTQTQTETLRSELPAPPAEVDPRVTRQLAPSPAVATPVQTARLDPVARPSPSVQPVPKLELPAQSAERLNTEVSATRIEAPKALERMAVPRPAELSTLPPLEAPAPRVATLPSPSEASPLSQAIRPQALSGLNAPSPALSPAPTLSLPERATSRLNADSVRPAERVQAPSLAPLAAAQGERARDLAANPTLSPSEHAVAQLPADAASSAARISAPSPLSRLAPSAAVQATLQGLKPMAVPAEGRSASEAGSSSPAANTAHSTNTANAATPGTSTAAQPAPVGPTTTSGGPATPLAARPAPVQGQVSLSGADAGQGPSPLPQPGSPEAGAQRGRDVATAPSAPASAPRLNLDLPTSQRGPVASSRSRALLEIAPNPPELKTKLQKEMEKALREDCRKAYAENGLLALGGIALDALRAKGCKF